MSRERIKKRAEERDRRRGRGETQGGYDSSSPEHQPRAGGRAHPGQGYDGNVGYLEYRPGEAASLSQDPVSGASAPHQGDAVTATAASPQPQGNIAPGAPALHQGHPSAGDPPSLQVKDIKWKRLTLGRDIKEQEHALLPRIKAMLILLL